MTLSLTSTGYHRVNLYSGEDLQRRYREALVHRLVGYAFDLPRTPEQTEIDHIDHDRTNNRVTNLRFCTRSENARNSSVRNSLGRLGVYMRKGLFVAQAYVHPRCIPLGTFDTVDDATLAVASWHERHSGEFVPTELKDVLAGTSRRIHREKKVHTLPKYIHRQPGGKYKVNIRAHNVQRGGFTTVEAAVRVRNEVLRIPRAEN